MKEEGNSTAVRISHPKYPIRGMLSLQFLVKWVIQIHVPMPQSNNETLITECFYINLLSSSGLYVLAMLKKFPTRTLALVASMQHIQM